MTEIDELRAEKIVAGWLWQMAEGHNYRWKGAARTMTLFYESAPLESDVAQLVIEYLKSREGVTEFVIAHKKWTFDNPWNAKDCWYQTMPGEKWAGTESTKVRVYWALVQAGDSAADGPYVVENGCKYKIEHSYFWDVASEPILPGSESGVQYSIQGFTRDRETGLFTYIVEKRETVQQDVPLYKSAETAFEQVEIEQHLGVKQASVASTGLAAGVTPGVRTERRLTKNPDCTTDIENVKHTAKKAEAARTVKRKTLRGTIAATTDRNLTDAEVAAKTASEIAVGEMRTTEETAEKLHDLTIEKTTPPATPLKIAESCEQQTSVHTDTKVEVIAAAGALPGTHVTAETNKEKIVSTRLNDDGVTADKTTTTREWKEKTGGGSTDSGGVVTTTTTRKENTTDQPAAEPSAVNQVVEIDEQPNDHGSKTTVKRVTTYKPQTKTATASDAGHAVEVESGINAPSAPSASGGVNESVDVSVSPNDHGTLSYSKRKTTYKPSVKKATASDAGHAVEVESGINAPSAPSASGGVNESVDVSVSPNDHGTLSFTKRKTTYKPNVTTATSNLPTERVVTTTTTNTAAKNPSATQGSASAQPNDHGTATTQVREVTPKAVSSGWIKWRTEEKGPRSIYKYECGLLIFRNQPAGAVAGLKAGAEGRVHVNAGLNQYALLDGSITYANLISWEARSDMDGVFGGSQERTVSYRYVYDYDISDAGGSLTVNPLFRTQEIRLRTYYGRGNEGSEAAAAALAVPLPPGLRVTGRTYIISPGAALMSGIIESIHRARVKLQTAYANGKAPAAANAGGGQ